MITSIKLDSSTKQRLFKYGVYGNTMDEILNKILDMIELK